MKILLHHDSPVYFQIIDIFIVANILVHMQILVLVDKITPRVRYIFNHILGGMLGLNPVFTDEATDYNDYSGVKLSYHSGGVSGGVNVNPHGLLSEVNIVSPAIVLSTWGSLPTFFETYINHEIPFDVFAASFFLITRYEEYLPFKPDEHGRFRAKNSLAYKFKFLELPLVDLWVMELGRTILKKYPEVKLRWRKFEFIPTIDVDNAFAFKHKGFSYNTLALGRSLILLRLRYSALRLQVVLRLRKDPYDSYEKLFDILDGCPNAIWFFLGGNRSKYDRNISLKKGAMQNLIREISSRYCVGVHPSYASGEDVDVVLKEISELSLCAGRNIDYSRQHFLRLRFPDTYNAIATAGISKDFTMGYSETIGFRASTCTPYNFYDLVNEKELSLKVVPFMIMDRALLDGLKLSAEDAVTETRKLVNVVKNVGGTFVLIWHNESLSGINEWKGWENVFGEIVKETGCNA